MPGRLSVFLLGPLEVRLEDQLVGGFESNKVRALLAYLAVEAGQPHTRSHLCALLWPNATERAARHSLSQALSALRHALGDLRTAAPFLQATTEALQLNPAAEVTVDVARFNALIAAAEAHTPVHRGWRLCTPCAERLGQAAALYRGDFLAQFFLNDSAPFEEWALLVRERQRQRMLSALERLSFYAEWRGSYEQAAEQVRRQVELEPLLEINHRRAMRLLAASGQTSAALTQYDHLRRLLAEQLAAEPEAETQELYQHIRAGTVPEATRSPRPASRLPAPPTRLIGREHEVASALAWMRSDDLRALTLTGPPGIGKTRLALELAHAARFDFDDGVCWVELAPLAQAAQVPAAIAQALGLHEQAGRPLPDTLAAALRPSHRLLVLDNFEHILGAAPLAADLLAACPALRLLVTSRSPLGIRAEQLFPLSPLALPDPDSTLDDIAHSPAVQLFLERANAVCPGFDLAGQAEIINRLCTRVDGLPLAIELVAARARTLAPADLLGQLEHGLEALSFGSRDLPERQRTLRGAIAWSYDRLGTNTQQLFARLGVFAGGFTLEAAQAVAGAERAPVLPGLETLHQSNLIQTKPGGEAPRFVLLETLREFALEQLQAQGVADGARQRHAEYYLALARQAQAELNGPDQKAWFEKLGREHANLRAALSWSAAHAPEAGLRLATALEEFWMRRGHVQEGRRWLKAALEQCPRAPLAVRALALLAAGQLALGQGELREAHELLAESRQLMLQVEDPIGLALVLGSLGTTLIRQANLTNGRIYLEESLSLARDARDQQATALALSRLAELAHRQGDNQLARTYTEQALTLSQARRDPHHIARQLMHLGLAVGELGEPVLARQSFEASVAIARELEDWVLISLCLLNLGNLQLAQGDAAGARASLEETLAIYRAYHYWTGADATLATLGRALEQLGDLEGARVQQVAALRLRVDGERRAVPISLTNLARLDYRENRPARAARLMGAAEAIREATGTPISPSRQAEYKRWVADVRAALGEAALAEAWAAGRALSQEEAVALALASP